MRVNGTFSCILLVTLVDKNEKIFESCRLRVVLEVVCISFSVYDFIKIFF